MVWLLEQMVPEAMLYNIVERFAIKGKLDVELLRRSLDAVISRHEVLHTVYPTKDGQPFQRIETAVPCRLRYIDLRDRPEHARDGEAQHFMIIDDVKRPFDLTVGPILRPMLLQLTEDEYVLRRDHAPHCDGRLVSWNCSSASLRPFIRHSWRVEHRMYLSSPCNTQILHIGSGLQ